RPRSQDPPPLERVDQLLVGRLTPRRHPHLTDAPPRLVALRQPVALAPRQFAMPAHALGAVVGEVGGRGALRRGGRGVVAPYRAAAARAVLVHHATPRGDQRASCDRPSSVSTYRCGSPPNPGPWSTTNPFRVNQPRCCAACHHSPAATRCNARRWERFSGCSWRVTAHRRSSRWEAAASPRRPSRPPRREGGTPPRSPPPAPPTRRRP